jgi:phage gp37-like protein
LKSVQDLEGEKEKSATEKQNLQSEIDRLKPMETEVAQLRQTKGVLEEQRLTLQKQVSLIPVASRVLDF